MFFNSIDNPIGLDISDISVKFVQFKKEKSGNLKMSGYGDFNLPQGLMVNDEIKDTQAMANYLKNIFAQKSEHTGRLHGRTIIASVPESKAFVRVIRFPKLKQEELSSAVPLEAEQYIPISVDEVELDWQIVGESHGELVVLIAATPKSYVENLIKVFRLAKFIPKALEVESAAVARCLLPVDPNLAKQTPASLILDLDAHRSSFIVYADGSIQFTSSVPLAGEAITSAIAKRLDVSTENAEQMKRLHGIPFYDTKKEKISPSKAKQLAEIKKAVEPVLENIFDEIKNTIKFHEGHTGEGENAPKKIEQILLCGGTSKLPNLSQYLQQKIQKDLYFEKRSIKVSTGNPWQNIINGSTPPFSRREALSYTTAIGLALREKI